MSSSALAILHAFHRQLQESVLSGIKHFHGKANPAIASYAARFQKSLPKDFRHVTQRRLIDQAQNADVVLFGDFHTLAESQRAFFEVLRMTYEQNPSRPITVALEIFAAADQTNIDEYLSGRLPEEYFLKRIDYHNKWGFPWENYRPIVEFCARYKLPIVGINHQTDQKDRLAKRDVFAAQIIDSIHAAQSQALIFCLIGEYHLADEHLPSRLKDKRVLRVVNNVDEYSLPFMDEPIASFEAVEIQPNFFCVLNTSPWLKWHSLALWEELHGLTEDSFYGGESDGFASEDFDVEYQLLFILKTLNEFMGLGISASQLSFDIYLKPDRATFSYLRGKFSLSRQSLESAERKLNQDGYCYLPKSKAILLLDFSMNHLLEVAGFILMECISEGLKKSFAFSDRVRYQMAGTVCGLLLNPRRSVFTVERVEIEWKATQRKRLLGESRKQREAYKLVRGFYEDDFSCLDKVSKALEEKDKDCNYLVSRIFGETLGAQLFSFLIRSDALEFKKGLKALFENDLKWNLELLELEPETLREAS
ncbi:MAG: hypothetical protein EOP10_22755 [Proteobacteria bacterium]|nr:MAG: hypothetical protein EOP10_22755 [Pseudomonadota bacterium]